MERLSDFYYKRENNFYYGDYTDKGTLHDYIDGYYDSEFTFRKEHNLKLLEIGIAEGGSLLLWKNYFTNSKIYAVDIADKILPQFQSLKNDPNTEVHFQNAYDDNFIQNFDDNYFDYIIDDGPHTLDSQVIAINKWMKKLKSNGKLIIEDIQVPQRDIPILMETAKQNSLCKRCTIIDLRLNTQKRYDDFIIEIVKI